MAKPDGLVSQCGSTIAVTFVGLFRLNSRLFGIELHLIEDMKECLRHDPIAQRYCSALGV